MCRHLLGLANQDKKRGHHEFRRQATSFGRSSVWMSSFVAQVIRGCCLSAVRAGTPGEVQRTKRGHHEFRGDEKGTSRIPQASHELWAIFRMDVVICSVS